MMNHNLFFFIIIALLSPTLFASHPPGEIVSTDCRYNGAIKLCIYNREFSDLNIEISYFGFLTDSPTPLKVFVMVNSRSHFFIMNKRVDHNFLKLNHLRNVHLCYHTGDPTNSPKIKYPICPTAQCKNDECLPGNLDWYSEAPPLIESKLFDGIYQDPVIEIEVAFTTGNNRWDSDYGRNYHFTF